MKGLNGTGLSSQIRIYKKTDNPVRFQTDCQILSKMEPSVAMRPKRTNPITKNDVYTIFAYPELHLG